MPHRLTALEHDGAKAHLRQHQRRKNSAGPEANDQRTVGKAGGCVGDRVVGDVRRRAHVRIALKLGQHRSLITQLAIDGVNKTQLGRFLARVIAALEHDEAQQITVRQA